MNTGELVFLKLGGSLITDKDKPLTARLEVMDRLAGEIAAAMAGRPEMHLVLGHGSGSFGHVPAHRYHTRAGVHSPAEWMGFLEVWRAAAALNRLVVDALGRAGLPVLALSPLASVMACDGQVGGWDLTIIQSALNANLVPVIQGDVIFDRQRGGTILSTEDLFIYLAQRLHPGRILLAGQEAGVWEDYPQRSRLIPEINPANLARYLAALGGSAATDVTGGMASKVTQCVKLVEQAPDTQVLIFSGEAPGLIAQALAGQAVGTVVRAVG